MRSRLKTYRAIGRDGLLAMGGKHARYDYETKVAAASAVVDGGMPKTEAMERFGIASATPLKQWCRLYREGGSGALLARKASGACLCDALAQLRGAARRDSLCDNGYVELLN